MPSSLQETTSLPNALHQYFGFQDFRPLQQEAIEAALGGNDAPDETQGAKVLLR